MPPDDRHEADTMRDRWADVEGRDRAALPAAYGAVGAGPAGEEDLRETTSAMLRYAPHNLDHDALAAFSHCIAAPGDVTCGAAESGAEEARQAVEVFAAKAVSSPGKPMRRAWRD
jgi:hypothetical protein